MSKEKNISKESLEVFENELIPHIDALHNFAYNLTFSEAYANDLVQETYLKAYRSIESYNPGTNAKAWLFKILKNIYINDYRSRSRRPSKVALDDVYVQSESSNANEAAYIDLRKEIFDDMMGDEVTIALNSLSEQFKTIILLADVEGFSYEEISKILDIPIGTVRSRLFRARNMLKEKLLSYAEDKGYKDRRGNKNKTT